jgi:hypothetical protein
MHPIHSPLPPPTRASGPTPSVAHVLFPKKLPSPAPPPVVISPGLCPANPQPHADSQPMSRLLPCPALSPPPHVSIPPGGPPTGSPICLAPPSSMACGAPQPAIVWCSRHTPPPASLSLPLLVPSMNVDRSTNILATPTALSFGAACALPFVPVLHPAGPAPHSLPRHRLPNELTLSRRLTDPQPDSAACALASRRTTAPPSAAPCRPPFSCAHAPPCPPPFCRPLRF